MAYLPEKVDLSKYNYANTQTNIRIPKIRKKIHQLTRNVAGPVPTFGAVNEEEEIQ